jgi:hypothetical protein
MSNSSGYLALPHMMGCEKCHNTTPHELLGTRWICMLCTQRERLESDYRADRKKLTRPIEGTQLNLDGIN